MKINMHILSEMIAQQDPAIISLHEVELNDDNIEISYDVVVPAKHITITKADYRKYSINSKIDKLLNSEEES